MKVDFWICFFLQMYIQKQIQKGLMMFLPEQFEKVKNH